MAVSIVEKKLDITSVEKGVVMHGCNCRGVMGSGVALAIRKKWPKAYNSYLYHCSTVDNPEQLLGSINRVNITPYDVHITPYELYVYNAFTQVDYGNDGQRYADIDAIMMCYRMALMNTSMLFGKGGTLYTPKIGCGLGGISYEKELKPRLEKELKTLPFELNLVICDL